MVRRVRACALATLLLLAGQARAQARTRSFESVPSRPLALSSDGTRLYAVNTPDAHLEIFDVTACQLGWLTAQHTARRIPAAAAYQPTMTTSLPRALLSSI